MKRLCLTVLFVSHLFMVKAQMSYNYNQFAIGLDVSYTRAYTNVAREDNHIAENVNFIYNYSPYIPVATEFQSGTLSGGGLTPKLDKYGRQYTNRFKACLLRGDFGLGEVIDYSQNYWLNILKNIYFGAGIGLVSNSNTVQRTNIYPWNGPLTYVFPGSDRSINVTVPLRFGYEFKFYNDFDEPYLAIDIGYIHNLVFGEGLDGYDDPNTKFKNNAVNQYRQIVIGVKYNFGRLTAYNKRITRY